MLGRLNSFLSRLQPIRSPGFKPVSRQYYEMLLYACRFRLSPTEYYLYQFGRRDMDIPRITDYLVTADAVNKLRPRLNPRTWEAVLRNKVLFHNHMAGLNLPVAKLYGIYHCGHGSTIDGEQLRQEDALLELIAIHGEVVVKPLDGLKGRQVTVLVRGQELPPYLRLASAGDNAFLVEERLVNVPELARFNPDSLNTCRVVTFVNGSGQARILFATARFGRRGHSTDNWSGGGIAAGIDLDSGVMGQGLILPQFGGGWHQRHPDSGLSFEGTEIPCWQQLKDLARQAACALPWCPAVGWDIALTPSGPVLVEGNGQWNPALGQAFVGGLLTPEFRRELAELGLNFPASS